MDQDQEEVEVIHPVSPSFSRKRTIEEKLKLVELEAEAAFTRKRTQIKMEQKN